MDQNLGLALYQGPVQGSHSQQVLALIKEYNNKIIYSSGCFGQTQNCREVDESKSKSQKPKLEEVRKISVIELCNSVNLQMREQRDVRKNGNIKNKKKNPDEKMAAHPIKSKTE